VAARTAHRSGRPHEDLVAITGQLADGTVTNHLVNWLSPMKERLTVITGEKGALVADTLTADLTFFENGVVPTEGALARFRGVTEGNVTRFAFPKPEPLRTEHESFRDALLGLDADIVTLQQAAATVAVANAAARSAAEGVMVSIDAVAG
jgi:predicted dehydrogenase